MSATVAAALKKIAVAVLTDKKLRRTVLGIVLGVIIKRSIEQKKNPYKNEIWKGTKDFELAMARAEEQK